MPHSTQRRWRLYSGHLEKLLVGDKSHVKHGKTFLLAKSLFPGLAGLIEKFEFFEVPFRQTPSIKRILSQPRYENMKIYCKASGGGSAYWRGNR